MKNKAILVVSFGTSYPETRKVTIEAVEQKIRENFPDYQVFLAFTSPRIIRHIQQTENLCVDDLRRAMERLKLAGVQSVIVQPLHIIAGEEWDKIAATVNVYAAAGCFSHLLLGKPLLFSTEDEKIALEALAGQLPKVANDEAVLLMGHGSPHHAANAVYARLQALLDERGLNVFMGTVEAPPTLDDVLVRLGAKNIKRIILMPFMLVAGNHAINDLAGEAEDSWKSRLLAHGYDVTVILRGLGENPLYQDIYVERVRKLAIIMDQSTLELA